MKKNYALAALLLACCLSLTGCSSFYELFTDGAEAGVYSVIYDESSTEEEVEAIPDVRLMAADLKDSILPLGLSYEITIAFDMETDNEATLTCYYYHNKEDESAADHCRIGAIYMGTYTMEEDTIRFQFEKEDGINVALYEVGSDYADREEFRQFSYGEDGGNGVWAYSVAPDDYEDAVIDSRIVEVVPDAVEFTVSGSRILSWTENSKETT